MAGFTSNADDGRNDGSAEIRARLAEALGIPSDSSTEDILRRALMTDSPEIIRMAKEYAQALERPSGGAVAALAKRLGLPANATFAQILRAGENRIERLAHEQRGATFSHRTAAIMRQDPECQRLAESGAGNAALARAQQRATAELGASAADAWTFAPKVRR